MYSVFLRAFEPDDYLLINKWRNDPEIQKLTSGTFRYVSSEREKEWVRDKMMNNITDIYLAICMQDESRLMVGYCSINNIDYLHRTADGGGIVIGDKNSHDGVILIDAMLQLLSYVFENLNINRFTAACLTGHINSRIMMEMMGFQHEGVKRQAVYKNSKYHDQYIFSILRDDYFQLLNDGEYTLFKLAKKVRDSLRNK